jgi:hypothetical protein
MILSIDRIGHTNNLLLKFSLKIVKFTLNENYSERY